MEAAHKQAIQRSFPEASGRVFVLGKLISRGEDVDDPIGRPLEEYERTYDLLEEWIREALPHIARLAGATSSTPTE